MNDSNTPPPDETIEFKGPQPSGSPQKIGPYTIKREIARGGMGVVFEATQEEPRRSVAIKVMQHSFAGEEMLRRFKYEAQLLGRLRHPGIAQVYEAGTYSEGGTEIPFFAMEYIPNAKSITEYAEAKKLSLKARLELFARVCDAVHHGHQRGIVHRDLKPGNVLIDSSGQPRVIDFGVARAIDSDMATIQTQVGQLIGSIQYMSPEQFDADPNDIDTRSDVYALGVVLYELLVGKPPYDLSTSTIVEAARVVQEQRLPKMGGSAALAGEVETIITKALEKDRENRYQSAHGLATDIRRYLNGEAIAAKPPSLAYQLKVFSRRNKALITAAATVLIVLVGASVFSTAAWVKSERERARAEEQTQKTVAAVEFLKGVVGSTVPYSFGAELTLRSVIDQAVRGVQDAFPDDPLTQADIYATLAESYEALWDWNKAELYSTMALDLRQKHLGPAHEQTLESMAQLQHVYVITDQMRDYELVCTTRVEGESELHGVDHPRTLNAKLDLAMAMAENGNVLEARRLAEEVLAVRSQELGDDHEDRLWAECYLATIALWAGRYEEAEVAGRSIMNRYSDQEGESQALSDLVQSQLGAALVAQGKLDEAAELWGNKRAPESLGILSAYQGITEPEMAGTNLYVFWESWCPFSQRAVPWLETLHRRYQEQDLNIFGFTTVSRTATDEKIQRFLRANDITYPIYKENGSARAYLDMPGTPFMTLFKDGRLIWENRLPTFHFPEKILVRALNGNS